MKKVLFGCLVLALVAAAPAFAGSDSSSFGVSAEVIESCSITSVGLSFGDYDALSGTPLDTAGSVEVTCSNGSSGFIGLDQGLNADTGSSEDAPLRQMASGTARLSYGLFSDASRSVVWGNTVLSGVAHTATDTNPVTVNIYGRVPISQGSLVGSYSDTVTATINF
jgi:spore coat protein U-like protein